MKQSFMHLYDVGFVYTAHVEISVMEFISPKYYFTLNEFRSCMSQNALPSQLVTTQCILLKI